MDKIGKLAGEHPIITTLVLVGGGLFAYHNGYLNFVFSKPSTAGITIDPATGKPKVN